MVKVYIKRIFRSRLRRVMRGYRCIKKNNQLDLIPNIRRDLTTTKIHNVDEDFSKSIFGSAAPKAELVIRQYLLHRLGLFRFSTALLLSLGKKGAKVYYPMPKVWAKVIEDNGIPVSILSTTLFWYAYVFAMFFRGVLFFIRNTINNIFSILFKKTTDLGKYVYFDGLIPAALPFYCKDGRSQDVINWYMQWEGRVTDINMLCHNIEQSSDKKVMVKDARLISIKTPIIPLKSFSQLASFFTSGLLAFFRCAYDLLLGRWWHALIYSESILAFTIEAHDDTSLAEEYMFRNAFFIYRPLWSYEAEEKGSKITFYFFSTNNEMARTDNGYPPPLYGYRSMSWPKYLVWDQYQADFVHRCVGKEANVQVVGPIWLATGSAEMPKVEPNSIAIFDVSPHRSSQYHGYGGGFFPYSLPKPCAEFLQQIYTAAKETNHHVIWKRKRKIGSLAHPVYRHASEKMLEKPEVSLIDPLTSAYRVVENSKLVICMPYTSVALIARELGKPACYYDSSRTLRNDDRAAHGIKIINNVVDLKQWILENSQDEQ